MGISWSKSFEVFVGPLLQVGSSDLKVWAHFSQIIGWAQAMAVGNKHLEVLICLMPERLVPYRIKIHESGSGRRFEDFLWGSGRDE